MALAVKRACGGQLKGSGKAGIGPGRNSTWVTLGKSPSCASSLIFICTGFYKPEILGSSSPSHNTDGNITPLPEKLGH